MFCQSSDKSPPFYLVNKEKKCFFLFLLDFLCEVKKKKKQLKSYSNKIYVSQLQAMVTMPPQPVQAIQTQTKLGVQQQQLQTQHNAPLVIPSTQTIVSNNQISKCCWHSKFGQRKQTNKQNFLYFFLKFSSIIVTILKFIHRMNLAKKNRFA